NWAGSDFSEKVNYQRALEGELERTLQTLNEVEAVRVHLVLPRESLFSEQEHVSKAAVIVKTKGGTLSREAQQAIPQLVASAVDGLRPENVTVVDADTAMSFLARRGPGGQASFDSDEELAAAAVHAIEPVHAGPNMFGPACTSTTTSAAARILLKLTIRKRPLLWSSNIPKNSPEAGAQRVYRAWPAMCPGAPPRSRRRRALRALHRAAAAPCRMFRPRLPLSTTRVRNPTARLSRSAKVSATS